MNAQDAAYDTVHQYPGGSVALAARLGMSDAVLRGKVNPNNDRNHLILHALAATHGYTLQEAGAREEGGVVIALLAAVSAQGGMTQTVSDAIADGLITPNEAAAIDRLCAQVQASVASLAGQARAAAEVEAAP